MSSAPPSALLSIVAAPALPAEAAAPAMPLDPTLISAFSRMLDAEASLAQAVASVPTSLVTAEAAALSENAPQLVTEQNIDSSNDVAVAMAQAAHAGLSPIPIAEEAPDFVEVPTTDVETELELDVEIRSENTEVPAAPRSSSSRTEAEAQQGTRSPQAAHAWHVVSTPQVARDLNVESAPQEDAAPAVKSNPTASPAPVTSTRAGAVQFDPETEIQAEVESSAPTRYAEVSQEFKADTGSTPVRLSAKASVPLEIEASADVESIFVEGQPAETWVRENANSTSAATAQTSEEHGEIDADKPPQTVVSANAGVQFKQTAMIKDTQHASTVPARTPATSSTEAKSPPVRMANVLRVSEYEERDIELAVSETEEATTDVAPIPMEIFLGAAGVLNAPAPREISSEPVEAEVSDEAQPRAEDTVDSDFSFASDVGQRFTRTATSKDDAASQGDFAADVEDVAVKVPAANRQVVSDADAEQAPAFVADLGEVRVIASQSTSRKDIQSVAADDTKQKEIEIQPLRTELRAVAVDRKGGETVAEPVMKAAEFARVLSGWNGEKIARQSSPEGFSTEAVQREISASTVTVPFIDGGRPETIASRNSAEPTLTANSSRAERLLDHTLDAIPNPLRVTTFEIKPEGHGTIRVRISARGEGEKAVWRVQIQTSDPAARSLLSEHLNELRERLPAENVQVELRGANDVRTEVTQRENGGSRERNGEQRQSRGEEQQRQPKQQKSGTFLEWLAAQE